MTISHDYYLKFLANDVFEETLSFHSKGNFTIHRSTKHFTTLHHLSESELKTLTGNEIKLYPDIATEHDQHHIPQINTEHPLSRNESCNEFFGQSIPFQNIGKLLSPLLGKPEHKFKRGYPSGGALYPVEVFCCNLSSKNTDWPKNQNILHLLPRSRKFEPLASNINTNTLLQAITPGPSDIGSPSAAIIYFMYLPKSLFKYRYRGYRLALMEAGSMYMLIDLRCKELHLQNRMWSGFSDYQITKTLKLNPALFLPLCVQLIG